MEAFVQNRMCVSVPEVQGDREGKTRLMMYCYDLSKLRCVPGIDNYRNFRYEIEYVPGAELVQESRRILRVAAYPN